MRGYIKKLLRESLLREGGGAKYRVRFNLANTKDKETNKSIFMTWKVVTDRPLVQGVELDFDPAEVIKSKEFESVPNGGVTNNFFAKGFSLTLTNCTLNNSTSAKGYEIKCHANKDVIAAVDASTLKVEFGFSEVSGQQLIYNPRMVPHWLLSVSVDPFKSIDGKVVYMGDGLNEDDEYDEDKTKIYVSCVNSVTPPPPTKYFYVELGGDRYVKVVGPEVDDYRASGDVYRIVDSESFGQIKTSGNRLYVVS